MATKRKSRQQDAPSETTPAALIDKAADFYHGSLSEDEQAYAFLRQARLADQHLLRTFAVGYCTGQLAAVLPAEQGSSRLHEALIHLGILSTNGTESLLGCLTMPLQDPEGGTVGIAGLNLATSAELLIGHDPPPVWNLPAAGAHADLICATCLLDGLALAAAGIPNILAFIGQPPKQTAETLTTLGVTSLTFLSSQDIAKTCSTHFDRILCQVLPSFGNRTPSDILRSRGPEELAAAVDKATPVALDVPADGSTTVLQDGFRCLFASRRYELRGIEKSSRRLKAVVRVERQGRLHVDTADFYSARSRRSLCLDLCQFFEAAREVIDADIDRLIRLCERWIEQRPEPDTTPPVQLTEREEAEARAFGTSPDLLEQLQHDYEICGIVGEEANKLLYYLAAVSRKMPEPLSILILSSSGAGKSALQQATLKLCPPEDVVKLTSMTGRALFYKGRTSLKHKVLALEEEAGAEGAAYPLRALISSGELIIETTVKDLGSGQLTTARNRVEGPTAVFITTTSPDTDPETRSRFFVTSVDESRAQTRRILDYQRKRRTLAGQSLSAVEQATISKHRNFQGLLLPVVVVNPFAETLAYADDRLRSRRDQPKLLNLIAAVGFLRQMGKTVRTLNAHQSKQPYIEVDAEDMRIAQELAEHVLRRSVDDLNPVSFQLLGQIRRLVNARMELAGAKDATPPDPRDIIFTRRELREFSGWPHIRVRRYLVELVEMEFVTLISGRMGHAYRYALCADPAQPGQGWSAPGHPLKSPQQSGNQPLTQNLVNWS